MARGTGRIVASFPYPHSTIKQRPLTRPPGAESEAPMRVLGGVTLTDR